MSKKCNHCQSGNINAEPQQIPLVAAECEATRQHETINHLIYAVMFITVLLFGSNLAWLFFGGII